MKRVVVGITGASGAVYGATLVRVLHDMGARQAYECHLIISSSATRVLAEETEWTARALKAYAIDHPHGDVGASIASGSFQTAGMIVAPCSVNTLAHIANGLQDNLIDRAAAVTLKERRPLVLLVRETPLSLIDIDNMAKVTRAGATVMPPVPAWYAKPMDLAAVVDHTVGRALDQLGITDHLLVDRWKDDSVGRLTVPVDS